jgi:hypothetical protein
MYISSVFDSVAKDVQKGKIKLVKQVGLPELGDWEIARAVNCGV